MLADELMDMLYKQDEELYGNVYMFLKRVLKDEEQLNQDEYDIRGLKRHCDDYCTELHSMDEYYESDAAGIVYDLRNMEEGPLRDRAVENRISGNVQVYNSVAGGPAWMHRGKLEHLIKQITKGFNTGQISEQQLEEMTELS